MEKFKIKIDCELRLLFNLLKQNIKFNRYLTTPLERFTQYSLFTLDKFAYSLKLRSFN